MQYHKWILESGPVPENWEMQDSVDVLHPEEFYFREQFTAKIICHSTVEGKERTGK